MNWPGDLVLEILFFFFLVSLQLGFQKYDFYTRSHLPAFFGVVRSGEK